MALASLLSWCAQNDVFIDPRICICHNQTRGIHVVSRDESIPPSVTLVRIPKSAVLSVKSCSLSEHIPFELHGLGAQLGLSFALYSEILQHNSKWSGYINSLSSVDLPIFWPCDSAERKNDVIDMDSSQLDDPLSWLRGTRVSRCLSEQNEIGQTLLESIDHYYQKQILPILQRPDIQSFLREAPALSGFWRAFSLVSSRAFLLDAYHGLAMTPVADAFNHVHENHVHIQSDFYVCPECGSLRECEHDVHDNIYAVKSSLGDEHINQDLYYEMVSNTNILPQEEVFNTYGEKLSSAELLMQYGFILDPNDNDMVHFDVSEISRLFPSSEGTPLDDNLDDKRFTSFAESFVTSTLVFVHVSCGTDAGFCIDSDGRISHQLWTILLKHLFRNPSSVGPSLWLSDQSLTKVVTTQIGMEANIRSATVGGGNSELDLQDSLVAPIILELARTVVKLCEMKKETIGYPGSTDEDLGELLDATPEDMTRLKLALSVAIGERSILDSCRFGWLDFIDGFTIDGDGDEASGNRC